MADLSELFDKIEKDYVARYNGITWENNKTPLNAENLNTMDGAIIHAMKQCSYINAEVERIEEETKISITELTNTVDSNKADTELKISEIQASLESLENTDIELSNRIEGNTSSISELYANFNVHVENTETTINDLKTQLEDFKSFSAYFEPSTGTLTLS